MLGGRRQSMVALVAHDFEVQAFGRYLLLDRISVGGMAEVYRGLSSGAAGFERMVALKRILPEIASDPDFVEMFIQEAKLAAQFQHANIAQVYDLGEVDRQYFIAMEYVSGIDVRTIWNAARRRRRLLPIAMSCHILQKCCEGLDAAHRKTDEKGEGLGLVHRDVSPQNVLVSFEGEVKVIDFGIAKVASHVSKTAGGALRGKFGYMSPEHVRGLPVDRRADIFACGVVFYELLIGRRLFLGDSEFSTLENIRKMPIVPPSEINRRLPPALDQIALRALARDPEERFGWASEMAEALQRFLFASEQSFSRADLLRYMHEHFGEELAEERVRLERYKGLSSRRIADAKSVENPSPFCEPSEFARREARTNTDFGEDSVDFSASATPLLPSLPASSSLAGPRSQSSFAGGSGTVPAEVLTLSSTDTADGPSLLTQASLSSSPVGPESVESCSLAMTPAGTTPAPVASLLPPNTADARSTGSPEVVLGADVGGAEKARRRSAETRSPVAPRLAVTPAEEKSASMARPSLPLWVGVLIGVVLSFLVMAGLAMRWLTPPEPGRVAVSVMPSDLRPHIYLDEQLVGNDGKWTFDLEPGTYVLRVSAPGYEDALRAVRVRSAESRQELMVLSRRPGTSALVIRTDPPGFSVQLDGQDTKKITPASFSGLYVGVLTVSLVSSSGKVRHEFSVELGLRDVAYFDIDLKNLPPTLDVTSSPPGALVTVDDIPYATTPTSIPKIEAGRRKVRLTLSGCRPYTKTVRLRPGDARSLHGQLKCDPSVTASATTQP
ncbi:MAG: PEGA domain-containing protein [Deltaproteobacteria bacterium]|nr:PEGA domain-containing protein [Deltaproteobacteria bacterium]